MSKVGPFIPVEATRVKYTYPIFAYKEGNKEPLIFDSQAKCIKMLGFIKGRINEYRLKSCDSL